MNKPKPNWGGHRPGAGRKDAGTKAYLLRMKPGTMRAIKDRMTKKLNTPGKVLDEKFKATLGAKG